LQSQKRRRANERTHLRRRVRNSGNSPLLPPKRLPRKSPTCVLFPPTCHFFSCVLAGRPYMHIARRHDLPTQEERGKENRAIVRVNTQDHFVFR
jgi:hypothetical protein